MFRALGVLLLALALAAPGAEAVVRSLRLDSGTVWGPKRECDAAQIDGNLLLWQGYRFSGFAPLQVQNTFCQHAPSLSVTSIPGTPGDEYAPIRALFRSGETISGSRWAFLSIPVDPCCTATGDSAFQWLFFHFDDVIIAGLFGPDEVGQDGIKRPVPVDASTTFLQGPDGTVLWDGGAYDGDWLCFRTDGSFMGAYADVDLAQCRQGNDSNPSSPAVVVVPDRDADGRDDLALLENTGITLLSGADGALLGGLQGPDPATRLVAAVVLPDTDADGVSELGMLVLRPDDQRGFVRLVELDASGVRDVPLPLNIGVTDMASVGDGNGDGIVDVGVLARLLDTGRNVVITRNLRRDASCATSLCPYATSVTRQAIDAEGLRILPMLDANGATRAAYAVLSRRLSDGSPLVQVTDSAAGVISRTLRYGAGRTPLDLAVLPDTDADGEAEVVVLMYSNIAPRTLASFRNLDGDGGRSRLFPAGRTPIALQALPDSDEDGSPEMAVLAVRDVDGSGIAQAREVLGSPIVRASLGVDPATRVRQMLLLPDLDADGFLEFGILGQDRALGRAVIVRGNISGDLKTFTYPTPP